MSFTNKEESHVEKAQVQSPDPTNGSLLRPAMAPTNTPGPAPVAAPVKVNDPGAAFTGKPAGASVADQFLGKK
jgi:hypothetical protein